MSSSSCGSYQQLHKKYKHNYKVKRNMWEDIYRSKGYIHRYLTGPQISTSSAKCTTRCVIVTKNEDGKYFSKTHMTSIILSLIFNSSSRLTSFEHMTLKNIDSCRIVARNDLCDLNTCIISTGRSCCMRM